MRTSIKREGTGDDMSDVFIERYKQCAGKAQEFELRTRLFYEVRTGKVAPKKLDHVISALPLKKTDKKLFREALHVRNKIIHGFFREAEEKVSDATGVAPVKIPVHVFEITPDITVVDIVMGDRPSNGTHRERKEETVFPWLISSCGPGALFDVADSLFDQIISYIKTS